jgi:hypothetical protein
MEEKVSFSTLYFDAILYGPIKHSAYLPTVFSGIQTSVNASQETHLEISRQQCSHMRQLGQLKGSERRQTEALKQKAALEAEALSVTKQVKARTLTDSDEEI